MATLLNEALLSYMNIPTSLSVIKLICGLDRSALHDSSLLYIYVSDCIVPTQASGFYPVPDTSGDGVLFPIDFFVYLLARLRENGWTNLHEIFREGAE